MWQTLQGVLRCATSNEAARSHYNKSSVEFQNEADDTNAKACTPRREVMSPRPAKTESVEIQLDVRRPDTFNYPKIPPKMLHSLTSTRINGALTRVPYAERESTNLGALEFWTNMHAIGMMTSPKVGLQTIRPGKSLLHWQNGQFFFALREEWHDFFFHFSLLQAEHTASKPEHQHGLVRKKWRIFICLKKSLTSCR